MTVAFRIAAAALVWSVCAAPLVLDAQGRAAGGQGRGGPAVQGRQGGGRAGVPPGGRGGVQPGGLTPRDIQGYFDTYVITEAERVLRISEDQYTRFVPRVRALQRIRREARVQRSRTLAQLNQLLRAGDSVDEARLAAATKAVDDQDLNAVLEAQKALAAIDEVLTPWQRARFRVLEDQLEQKKVDMMFRAGRGSRR